MTSIIHNGTTIPLMRQAEAAFIQHCLRWGSAINHVTIQDNAVVYTESWI